MPPITGAQILPNADLAIAVGLLILINAIGDMFSVNFTAKIFTKAFLNYQQEIWSLSIFGKALFRIPTKSDGAKEAVFYVTILLDLAFAVLCLVVVLMGSSVMFGIQVGEYGLSLDQQTLALMWQSAASIQKRSVHFYPTFIILRHMGKRFSIKLNRGIQVRLHPTNERHFPHCLLNIDLHKWTSILA